MKQLLLVLTLLFTNVLYGVSQDFRSCKWGDDKSRIIASEKYAPDDVSSDGIFYHKKTVLNKPCDYYFSLNKGVLIGGVYMFKSKYVNSNNYLSEYESIKQSLITKYGAPFRDEIDWKKDTFKDNPNYHDLALTSGHVVYKCTWKTERSIIILKLSGENYEPYNSISYFDMEYMKNYKPDTEGL